MLFVTGLGTLIALYASEYVTPTMLEWAIAAFRGVQPLRLLHGLSRHGRQPAAPLSGLGKRSVSARIS